MTLVLNFYARSDRGLVRQNNQDAVYAGSRLLALADGMGGHAAGEVASQLVIEALLPLDDDEPGADLLAQLRAAAEDGNAAITDAVAQQPDLDGMGTTLTAILFAGNRLGLVHVGDSRAYLFRDGLLTQITKDDTFVQSLIDEGRITEEEAHTHPQRSLLLRAVTGHDLEPSLTIREARAGDRYLLCSDGLSGVVSKETLEETLRIPDPRVCGDKMIELALRGGGPDNITCIVADVVDVDFGDDAPILGGAAGNGVQPDPPPPDSAAARASATTLPPVPPRRIEPRAEVAPQRQRRAPWRVLGIVVVLSAAVLGLVSWLVMQQYYVGVDGEELAIYRGVQGDVLGVPLHQLVEGSCPSEQFGCSTLRLADLQETAQTTVREGIPTQGGLIGARRKVSDLREHQLLPPCTPPVPQLPPGATSQQFPPVGSNPTGTSPTPGLPPAQNPGGVTPTGPTQPPTQPESNRPCRTVS